MSKRLAGVDGARVRGGGWAGGAVRVVGGVGRGGIVAVGAYDQVLSPDEIVEVLREKVANGVDLKLGRIYA